MLMESAAEILADVAESYGTPCYVYQLAAMRDAAAALNAALPADVRIFYSAKANPHPLLIRTAVSCGLDIEVSSVGELRMASAGRAPTRRMLYTGPGKTALELTAAVSEGVRLFSVESATDRTRLAAATDRAVDYLLRLNLAGTGVSAGLRMTGTPSQFGVTPDVIADQPGLIKPAGLARPVGFHLFSATNVVAPETLVDEFGANLAAASALAERFGFRPEVVDIGGGFASPYMRPGTRPDYPGLRQGLTRRLDDAFPGWRTGQPTIAVESGRFLAGGAGTLLTRVLDVKGGYLVCDAGINALGGMYGTGRLVAPKAQPDDQSADAPTVILVGPLCTPLDVLSRSARIAEPRVGQLLCIPNVGAYGLTASLVGFLGRPLPAEVVLDGTTVVDARRLDLVASSLAPLPHHAAIN